MSQHGTKRQMVRDSSESFKERCDKDKPVLQVRFETKETLSRTVVS